MVGGLGEYTRDPSYSTWEQFQQEITKRYIGIEEEQRALEEMNKVVYKGKINTYLLLLENLNIKAGLTGIAWRVRVESGLPEDIHQQEFHFAPGAPGASDASGAPGANRCSGYVVAYSFRPDAYPTRPGAPDAPGRQPPSILHLLSALDFC